MWCSLPQSCGVSFSCYDDLSLQRSVEEGKLAVVKYLCSLETRSIMSLVTLIGTAAQHGHREVVEHLYSLWALCAGQKGSCVSVAFQNVFGEMVSRGKLDVMEHLCKSDVYTGASIDINEVVKRAAEEDMFEVVECLFSLPSSYGFTPSRIGSLVKKKDCLDAMNRGLMTRYFERRLGALRVCLCASDTRVSKGVI